MATALELKTAGFSDTEISEFQKQPLIGAGFTSEEIDISQVPEEFRGQFEEAQKTGAKLDITIPPNIDADKMKKSIAIGNILDIPSSQVYDNVDIYSSELDHKRKEHETKEAQVGGFIPYEGTPVIDIKPMENVFVSVSEFYDPEFRVKLENDFAIKGKRPNLIVKRKVGPEHSLVAVPEGIMSFVTGFGATIAGGISGLVNGVITGDVEKAGQTLEEVAKSLTYTPRTEAGQKSAEILSKPFELIMKGLEFVGNETWEAADKSKTEQLNIYRDFAIENPEKMKAENNMLKKDFANPEQYAQETYDALELVSPELLATGVGIGTAFMLMFIVKKAENLPKQIRSSQWWREMTVKERGLVTITNERLIKGLKEQGLRDGQIARKLKAQGMPEYFNELNKQRIKGEKPLSEIVKTPEQVEGTLGELREVKFDRQVIRKKIVENKLAGRDAFEGVSEAELGFVQKEALKERVVEPVSKDRIKELEGKKINAINVDEATELVIEGKNIKSHLEDALQEGKNYDVIRNDMRELLTSKLAEDKTLTTAEKSRVESKLDQQLADAYEKFLIGEEKVEVKPVKKKPERSEFIRDIEELYADAIDIADKKGERVEVKRLQEELAFIGGKITTPSEVRKLRQTIHAWSARKGLTKKKLTELTKKVTGHLSTTHKDVTVEQLKTLLANIKKARPAVVKHKKVITLTTEKRIQTLKETLKKRDELTDKHFDELLKSMRIKIPKYVTAKDFITETQGKDLIDRMLKIVPLVKDEIQVKKALKDVPQIKGSVARLETHFRQEQGDRPAKLGRIQQLLDMHHFTDSMEKQTGAPFGRIGEKLNDKRRELDTRVDVKMNDLQEAGGKNFKTIVADEEAVTRINNYVASKLPEYIKGKPERPVNITAPEISMAEEMIKTLKGFEPDVRYNRFYEWREKGVKIPNAPASELRKATELLETQGDTALREWLKGRSWGVIRTGYDIGEVIKPTIKLYERKPGFSKQHLRPRESIVFQTYERDIIKRYGTYVRQMTFRTELKTDINAWTSLFDMNKGKFENPSQVADLLTRNITELLGQRQPPAVLEEVVVRLYSQAARTIFLDIRKGVRNLFQNVAFYNGIEDMFRMEKMKPADLDYFAAHVSQSKGIQRDWLYQHYGGIPGLGKLNKIADEINVMGRSDTINRLLSFKAKLGNVRRALKEHPDYKTDIQEMRALQKDIGFSDIEPMERVHALKVLAVEGEGAFSRYMAKAITQKVHFLYERVQRSPAEQGNELSRLLSNLLTFRKGYAQRLVLDVRKLAPSQKEIEAEIEGGRGRIVKRSIVGMMITSAFASYLYQQLTGDDRAPYAPHQILGDLSLGGLATGAQEQVGDFTRNAILAVTGDKEALARTVNNITRAADMFIPFYDEVINALEGMSGYQNIDKAMLRQLRSALDDRYKAKPMGFYKKERDAIETGQHIIFGTDKEQKKRISTKGAGK